tara:strand:+ start:83 stop:559 length:477 start_codon:yes stop_codon:yes gene_type:complete
METLRTEASRAMWLQKKLNLRGIKNASDLSKEADVQYQLAHKWWHGKTTKTTVDMAYLLRLDILPIEWLFEDVDISVFGDDSRETLRKHGEAFDKEHTDAALRALFQYLKKYKNPHSTIETNDIVKAFWIFKSMLEIKGVTEEKLFELGDTFSKEAVA